MTEYKTKADNRGQDVIPIANSFIAAYLIIIVVIAFFSNVILLMVLKRKRKLRSFHWCASALSLSDILFSILLHPMSIATSLGVDPSTIFNYKGCLYFGFLALTLGTFNMIIHALLAIIRYVNLCHPKKVYWFRKKKVLFLLILAAIYSLIWSSGPFVGVGKYETFEVGCTIAFGDRTVSGRIFITSAFIFVFFLPLTIIVISYGKITVRVTRQRKLLLRVGRLSVGKSNKSKSRLKVKSPQIKLIKLTALIAGCFILAWCPYAIVCLWQAYVDHSLSRVYIVVAGLFCKTATTYNPFVYMFLSKSIRTETVKLFREFCGPFSSDKTFNSVINTSRKSSTVRRSLRSSWMSSRSSLKTSHV